MRELDEKLSFRTCESNCLPLIGNTMAMLKLSVVFGSLQFYSRYGEYSIVVIWLTDEIWTIWSWFSAKKRFARHSLSLSPLSPSRLPIIQSILLDMLINEEIRFRNVTLLSSAPFPLPSSSASSSSGSICVTSIVTLSLPVFLVIRSSSLSERVFLVYLWQL